MEKLTNKEEEVMHILWKLGKGFVNDILEQMPEPNPITIRRLRLCVFWKTKGLLLIRLTANHTNSTSLSRWRIIEPPWLRIQ